MTTATPNKFGAMRALIAAEKATEAARKKTRVAWEKMQVVRKHLQESLAAVGFAETNEAVLQSEQDQLHRIVYP